MPKQIHSLIYILLVLINSFIGFLAMYSMGQSGRQTAKEEKVIWSIKTLNLNKEKNYSYIEINCSELMYFYHEFYEFSNVQICPMKEGPMKLAKISILLSTLFNSILPYALYGPPLMPVIIITIISPILWYTNFTEDEWTIKLMESTSILAGYAMIVGQCVIAHFGNSFTCRRGKSKPLLLAINTSDNHEYDNVSNYEHLHEH